MWGFTFASSHLNFLNFLSSLASGIITLQVCLHFHAPSSGFLLYLPSFSISHYTRALGGHSDSSFLVFILYFEVHSYPITLPLAVLPFICMYVRMHVCMFACMISVCKLKIKKTKKNLKKKTPLPSFLLLYPQ